jgi:hypothetical protein
MGLDSLCLFSMFSIRQLRNFFAEPSFASQLAGFLTTPTTLTTFITTLKRNLGRTGQLPE